MSIGHFAIAFVIISLFPGVPLLVPLIGVAFPDLLWPVLVLLGIEKVKFDKNSPLQKDIKFENYPISHSLVLTTLIAFIVGLIMAFFLKNIFVAPIFAIASASHWFLDAIVHNKDLPVLGFSSKDINVGLGMWKNGPLSFAFEYIFYAIISMLVVPIGSILLILILGAIFHLTNINSFFGISKKNTSSSPKIFAIIVLVSLILYIFLAQLILS